MKENVWPGRLGRWAVAIFCCAWGMTIVGAVLYAATKEEFFLGLFDWSTVRGLIELLLFSWFVAARLPFGQPAR